MANKVETWRSMEFLKLSLQTYPQLQRMEVKHDRITADGTVVIHCTVNGVPLKSFSVNESMPDEEVKAVYDRIRTGAFIYNNL